MRQYHLLIFVIFLGNSCWGQKEAPLLPIDSVTGKITYMEIVGVDSSLKTNELFNNAREWFAKTYISSNEVIQLEDKEQGVIIGKGIIPVYYKYMGNNTQDGYMNYTISVYLKDGRYKYELTDFSHEPHLIGGNNYGSAEEMLNTNKVGYQKILNNMLNQMNIKVNEVIKSLKLAMGKKNSFNNW
jgi:hypothetical protein